MFALRHKKKEFKNKAKMHCFIVVIKATTKENVASIWKRRQEER